MSLRVFVTPPTFPKFVELEARMRAQEKGQERFALVALDDVRKLLPILAQDPVGIWFAHAPDRAKLVEVLAVLRGLRRWIEDGDLKVIVTLTDRNPLVARKLIESGAHEVLVEPVTAKTIEAKFNRLSAALGLTANPGAATGKESSKAETKGESRKSGAGAESVSREVEWVKPIGGECECWVFTRKDVRRNMGTWTTLLLGPTGGEGHWTGVSEDLRTGEGEWKWVFAKDDPVLCKEAGSWFFKGRKPEFRGEYWAFIGARPTLSFRAEGKDERFKIQTASDGHVIAAENSTFAEGVVSVLRERLEMLSRVKELEQKRPTRESLEKRDRDTELRLSEGVRELDLRLEAKKELEAILEKSTAATKLAFRTEPPPRDTEAYQAELDRALGPLEKGPRLGPLGLAFFLAEIALLPNRPREERVKIAQKLFSAAIGGTVEIRNEGVLVTSSIALPDGWDKILEEITLGLRLDLR